MVVSVSPDKSRTDLGWLLESFLANVPGTDSALLASREGLKLALAGLSVDEADQLSAVMSGAYSLSRGVGKIKQASQTIRQIVIEGEEWNLFLMSAGAGLPPGTPVQSHTDPATVGTLLAVLARPDADVGLVGYEMATLISSVAEHLVLPVRQSTPSLSQGQ